jgi:hypothetical protein
MAVAVLGLSASRQLLAVRRETMVFLAAGLVSIGVLGGTPVILARALALIAATVTFLVHATASAVHRQVPGPKQRLFLLTTLLIGALGATLAVAARLDLSHLPPD